MHCMARGQRKSKDCKRVGVRQGPAFIVATRGQGQAASPSVDLSSIFVTFTPFLHVMQYNLSITLPLIYCRKDSHTDFN